MAPSSGAISVPLAGRNERATEWRRLQVAAQRNAERECTVARGSKQGCGLTLKFLQSTPISTRTECGWCPLKFLPSLGRRKEFLNCPISQHELDCRADAFSKFTGPASESKCDALE